MVHRQERQKGQKKDQNLMWRLHGTEKLEAREIKVFRWIK